MFLGSKTLKKTLLDQAKEQAVTYSPVSWWWSSTLVAKSTICSIMFLQIAKCFLYWFWARSAAIFWHISISLFISSACSNLACWAKAWTKPQAERWDEWGRKHAKYSQSRGWKKYWKACFFFSSYLTASLASAFWNSLSFICRYCSSLNKRFSKITSFSRRIWRSWAAKRCSRRVGRVRRRTSCSSRRASWGEMKS